MSKMAAMPRYGQNIKNLLVWNQKAYDLETWFPALGSGVLQNYSNDDTKLTLTYFMTSNLVPWAFKWKDA